MIVVRVQEPTTVVVDDHTTVRVEEQVVAVRVGVRGPQGPAVTAANLATEITEYFDTNPIDGEDIEWEGAPAPLLTYNNAKV